MKTRLYINTQRARNLSAQASDKKEDSRPTDLALDVKGLFVSILIAIWLGTYHVQAAAVFAHFMVRN